MPEKKVYESKHHDFHGIKEDVDEEIRATRSVWKLDPKGYFLIRLKRDDGIIEVGYCTTDNILRKIIRGKTAEPIYETLVRDGLVSLYEHACYLGKELKKAEIAMKQGLEYIQDDPISYENDKDKTSK